VGVGVRVRERKKFKAMGRESTHTPWERHDSIKFSARVF